MGAIITLKGRDHPEADERHPIDGEVSYTLRFPLEHGDELHLLVGEDTYINFERMILQKRMDDSLRAIGVDPG